MFYNGVIAKTALEFDTQKCYNPLDKDSADTLEHEEESLYVC
jgi:hypothetical protein